MFTKEEKTALFKNMFYFAITMVSFCVAMKFVSSYFAAHLINSVEHNLFLLLLFLPFALLIFTFIGIFYKKVENITDTIFVNVRARILQKKEMDGDIL